MGEEPVADFFPATVVVGGLTQAAEFVEFEVVVELTLFVVLLAAFIVASASASVSAIAIAAASVAFMAHAAAEVTSVTSAAPVAFVAVAVDAPYRCSSSLIIVS